MDQEEQASKGRNMNRRQLLKGLGVAGIAGLGLLAAKPGGWDFEAGSSARAEAAGVSCCCNVKDFGAVGDGVTDDTAAIQSALDTCRVVYLPAGVYKTTGTLYVPSNGGLVGQESSNWDFPSFGTWIVSSASIAIQIGKDTSFVTSTVIDKLAVKRSGFVNGGSVSGTGIVYYSAYYSSSRDIYVEGFETGIQLGAAASPHKGLGLTFMNTNVAGCNVCIHALKAADVSFYGGRIGMNGVDAARGTGFKISGNCDSIAAYRLIIANNYGFNHCVHITNATSIFWVTFTDCDMETATSAAFLCDTTATFVRIENAWVGSPAPFIVSAGSRFIFTRNTFANHDGLPRVVYLTGGSYIEVSNNDFMSSPSSQIEITNATGVKVLANNLLGGAGIGVKIAPTSTTGDLGGHQISSNEIANSADNGISIAANAKLSKISITDNHIVNFVNFGILVAGTGPAKCNYTITGNVIATSRTSGARRGVNIASGGIDYYVITGNDTSSCTTPAIHDAGGTHKVVANNLS